MLRAVTDTYPQPVAQAYGRISRSLTSVARLDAVLRCAEVLARYLAALGVASYAARDDVSEAPPAVFATFRGHLAFGSFLDVAKASARLKTPHPLLFPLSKALAAKKSPLETGIGLLLQLRNELGHSLQGIDEGRASKALAGDAPAFLGSQRPETLLDAVLDAARPVCDLPLLYLDGVEWADTGFVARCHLLMGEGEPVPQTFHVRSAPPFPPTKRLYVATRSGLLSVHPKLVWDYEPSRSTRGVYLLDTIGETALGYRAVTAEGAPSAPPSPEDLVGILEGTVTRATCPLPLEDGRRLDEVWAEHRDALLDGTVGTMRAVEWTDLDASTLTWYARLLQTRLDMPQGAPADLIRQALLDGRGDVSTDELRQLQLLFGTEPNIRRALGRPVVDLRARSSEEGRFDVREEVHANIVTALQHAVRFVARHNDDVDDGLDAEALDATVGSADYVAVREALVNLLVHQDYQDRRLAGQIELVPHRTTLINAGHSLVPAAEVFDGGNLSRNPLIARALKLIGFAELAGSGLREVARAWRQVGRRRPEIDSDADANRFRITLDSRDAESMTDTFWKAKAGVSATPDEARLLGVLAEASDGLTAADTADRTGADPIAVVEALNHLVLQQVVERQDETFTLKDRFVDVARQATL